MIYTLLDSGGNTISFDCVTSASINQEATVTEFPTETGSPITDHIFLSNTKINISGVVSDFNFFNPLTNNGGSAIYFDSSGNIVGGTLEPNNKTIEVVRSIFRNRDLVTVVVSKENGGEVERYTDCAIQTFSVDDKPDNGESTTFNLSLVQIRRVSVRTETVTKPPELLRTAAQVKQEEAAAEAAKQEEEKIPEKELTEAEKRNQASVNDSKAQVASIQAQIDDIQKIIDNLEGGRK